MTPPPPLKLNFICAPFRDPALAFPWPLVSSVVSLGGAQIPGWESFVEMLEAKTKAAWSQRLIGLVPSSLAVVKNMGVQKYYIFRCILGKNTGVSILVLMSRPSRYPYRSRYPCGSRYRYRTDKICTLSESRRGGVSFTVLVPRPLCTLGSRYPNKTGVSVSKLFPFLFGYRDPP